jgi:hypothetical protein
VLNYTKSYFQNIPMLATLVEKETANGLELSNNVDIAVATNSFRAVRGRSILCAVLDETAFYRDEESATPDVELFRALEPGLASLSGSIVIGIKAPTSALNPTIDQVIIDKALREDPNAARAEWLAEWRDDLADFISSEALRACVKDGVRERRPEGRHRYVGFVDPSGGVNDAMTLAVAHKEADTAIVDTLREFRAPFNPEAAVSEFADLLRKYRLARVTGDRYAGE